jgi:hypothetical protein
VGALLHSHLQVFVCGTENIKYEQMDTNMDTLHG